ncbi:hypothetical protein N7468_002479 [Penicillium chermesinum]|uniref:Atos-like conserved domain-containing protein n=1 Tax=Penicillium chermesinum TaxID=63820 RepID=A0A9W9PK88_9EURO|nr:uncharacterized protein N7468_002479 [Penicillium chermesinum]KAJ5247496.1 hypothetical protein N7468_002479 [Penicillium chermesinum]
MPLFQKPDHRCCSPWSLDRQLEPPAPGSSGGRQGEPGQNTKDYKPSLQMARPQSNMESQRNLGNNDRQELIQRIKESSNWKLQYREQSSADDTHMAQDTLGEPNEESMQDNLPSRHRSASPAREELGSAADIQRPRSALHSGDFREGATAHEPPQSPRPHLSVPIPSSPFPSLGTSPTTPWFGPSGFPTPTRRAPAFGDVREQPTDGELCLQRPFDTYKKAHLPCGQSTSIFLLVSETFFFHPPSSPRRSLTAAYSLQLASTASASADRPRRSSFISDASPKPHAPMVGSYEESLLRGRMSMNPSKPLDFTAQIGVLGKGKCKGHLKCPPHVTVPFPAVFYSYPTSGNGRSISDDSPSPYVGQIDLENSLPREDPSTSRRRKRHYSPAVAPEEIDRDEAGPPRVSDADSRRRKEKKNRRAESPKCPPSDMEPGTKTFIRQRSYSAGPIIDMPLNARKNFGTDRPEASLNPTEDPRDKPTLRYLIHLNICCPSRGRFYLHSSVRVVFANRVPDGKEKLRNEIQLPEPRYTPYKPTRELTISTSASTSTRLAIDQASRRRSAGQSTLPMIRPYASSGNGGPLHWTAAEHMGLNQPRQPLNQAEATLYNKLNKGDVGYGGHLTSSGPNSADTGESLLAKRLRGLDVHRPGALDRR